MSCTRPFLITWRKRRKKEKQGKSERWKHDGNQSSYLVPDLTKKEIYMKQNFDLLGTNWYNIQQFIYSFISFFFNLFNPFNAQAVFSYEPKIVQVIRMMQNRILNACTFSYETTDIAVYEIQWNIQYEDNQWRNYGAGLWGQGKGGGTRAPGATLGERWNRSDI